MDLNVAISRREVFLKQSLREAAILSAPHTK